MKSNDAILTALLIVLVIIVVFQGIAWKKSRNHGCGNCDGFSGAQPPFSAGVHNPHTVLGKQLDAIRGYRNDGYNQTPIHQSPQGLDLYNRSGAGVSPEDIADAERAQWYASIDASSSGQFNTELGQNPADDTMQYHSPKPAMDYDTFVTNLVTDPRTRENHRRWVEEMKPWSGTARVVDDMDEAMEATTDFIGLRRPQAVTQYNPLQLTERDTYDLAQNPKFNFRG